MYSEVEKRRKIQNIAVVESKIQRRSFHQISSNATMIVSLSNYDRAKVVKATERPLVPGNQ